MIENIVEFGDCRDTMKKWKEQGVQVQTTITSPPYYGLRDYGRDGQLGREETPQQFIDNLVDVFECVRAITREDGTCWVNLGDTYAHSGIGGNNNTLTPNKKVINHEIGVKLPANIKSKDLIGIPWMFAFAAREAGWYLRQDVIWNKPSCMPESMTDRCTKSHEYIFLLAKSDDYYFDNEAIKCATLTKKSKQARPIPLEDKKWIDTSKHKINNTPGVTPHGGFKHNDYDEKNHRSVWTIATQPFSEAHFAPYPDEIVATCLAASTRRGDIVLDPFMGSGTTGSVAKLYGRKYLGCELNTDFRDIQNRRLNSKGANEMLISDPDSVLYVHVDGNEQPEQKNGLESLLG